MRSATEGVRGSFCAARCAVENAVPGWCCSVRHPNSAAKQRRGGSTKRLKLESGVNRVLDLGLETLGNLARGFERNRRRGRAKGFRV